MAQRIKTTQITVASTAELQAKVAEYAAQGFQPKAMTDTMASLEKLESPFKVGRFLLLLALCFIPGIIYGARNNPLNKAGEVILIRVEAGAAQ